MSYRNQRFRAEIDALRIGLGAQLAELHPELKELAIMNPRIGLAWFIFDELPKLMVKKDPMEFVKGLLKDIGISEAFIDPTWNEVSRLSMGVGDTRKGFSVKPKDVK